MSTTKPNKRKYKKTTLAPAKREFARRYALSENATQAVMDAFPHITNRRVAQVMGSRLLSNDMVILEIEQQNDLMAINASMATIKLGEHIDSLDESVSLSATKFAIEQVHGKATQRTEVKSAHVSVVYDLSGGQAGDVPQHILDQLAEE